LRIDGKQLVLVTENEIVARGIFVKNPVVAQDLDVVFAVFGVKRQFAGQYVFFIIPGEFGRFMVVIEVDEFLSVECKPLCFLGNQVDAEVAFFIGSLGNDDVLEDVVFERNASIRLAVIDDRSDAVAVGRIITVGVICRTHRIDVNRAIVDAEVVLPDAVVELRVKRSIVGGLRHGNSSHEHKGW